MLPVCKTVRRFMERDMRPADDKLPHAAVLGDQGAGFAIAEEWLVHARVPYAAAGIGAAQVSLDLALGWARQRKTFGSLLADKQAIQWMLADSEVDLRAARLLVYQTAWNGDRGRDRGGAAVAQAPEQNGLLALAAGDGVRG